MGRPYSSPVDISATNQTSHVAPALQKQHTLMHAQVHTQAFTSSIDEGKSDQQCVLCLLIGRRRARVVRRAHVRRSRAHCRFVGNACEHTGRSG